MDTGSKAYINLDHVGTALIVCLKLVNQALRGEGGGGSNFLRGGLAPINQFKSGSDRSKSVLSSYWAPYLLIHFPLGERTLHEPQAFWGQAVCKRDMGVSLLEDICFGCF